MSICKIKTHCRLCGSADLELVLDLGFSPLGEDFILPAQQAKEQPLFPLTLMRCTACGHVQLGQVLDKTAVYTEYLYESTRSLGLDKHFEDYATTLLGLPEILPGQWAVDIGSNAGILLNALQNRGMRVQGVEPNVRIAQKATTAGIPTQACYFDTSFAKNFCTTNGQASIVTANNVFANIDDLDAVMEAVNELLTPDGYFIVETGYALDLIQNFVIDNIYHEHISYFLLTPLVNYFFKHDLHVFRVDRIPTKGGSIRIYAHRMKKTAKIPWGVEGLMRLEQELMFTGSIPYTSFEHSARQKKEKIRNSVAERAKIGPLAAFGASVGCTTMLYWLDILEHIKFITDDNVVMHGRLSPHAHIPVLPPEALYMRKPATLVNLPWRYLQPIMQKHQMYLKQGGRILQVLPTAVLV